MTTSTRYPQAAIEADPKVPIIRITRDFRGTTAQLMKAHTDPELYARWVGPDGVPCKIIDWDARNGGSWRYVAIAGRRRARLPWLLPHRLRRQDRADLHLGGHARPGVAGNGVV